MDLASAVQFLLAYEASLKLAPGQKPPPPSPSLFAQLSDAVRAIEKEIADKGPNSRLSGLPPSVWSDWPLCCGVDLTPKELQAARSLSPLLLRSRGLLSLFLALQSCAVGRVGNAKHLAYLVLLPLSMIHSLKEEDPALFPSVHLAARVGHRLINADATLDFQINIHGVNLVFLWENLVSVPVSIASKARDRFSRALPAVPHMAAGLSLAKEAAVMLEALCTAQARCVVNGLPFSHGCKLAHWLDEVLEWAQVKSVVWTFRKDLYREAAALPGYNPMLLLQTVFRNTRHGMSSSAKGGSLEAGRALFWMPLSYRSPLGRLRPADGYTALRLGLEDLGRNRPDENDWSILFLGFVFQALYSGLVQPELILRASPQLLEGLVECLARNRIPEIDSEATILVSLLTQSPVVGFHLRKFFSRSGCLQACQAAAAREPVANNCQKDLIRLLGPRAAQSGTEPWMSPSCLLQSIETGGADLRDTGGDKGPWTSALICDFFIRDLTADMLRAPRHAQYFLQYLSELAKAIAASDESFPRAQYGVLMVVGLGKSCLAFSNIVTTALQDIGVPAGPKGKGMRGQAGAGVMSANAVNKRWRAQLVGMGKDLCLLRRRVLRELLPLAEAREAALWEGVREEEVVAALRGAA